MKALMKFRIWFLKLFKTQDLNWETFEQLESKKFQQEGSRYDHRRN